jgi:hypothetical protein
MIINPEYPPANAQVIFNRDLNGLSDSVTRFKAELLRSKKLDQELQGRGFKSQRERSSDDDVDSMQPTQQETASRKNPFARSGLPRGGIIPIIARHLHHEIICSSKFDIATVLFVLGLLDRLSDLADVRTDEVRLALDEEHLPQRIRASSANPGLHSV